MKLAFLIYRYFPHGGLQRDFLRIAEACLSRGHEVRVYTLRWEGDCPEGLDVRIVPVRAFSRHRLYPRFSRWVQQALEREGVDAVVGFNRMPGLDIYYAADPCFLEKARQDRGAYYRHTPRYRHFRDWEEAVFGAHSRTQILLLSELQRSQYLSHYPRAQQRMWMLPPGLDPSRLPRADAAARRQAFRQQFGLRDDDLAIVQVGSGFRVKGVDRSLKAIASLPEALRQRVQYFVVGQGKSRPFEKLAQRLYLGRQTRFTGARDDVMDFLLGCDLMLHPAYSESGGYVLLEGVVTGLPVLTTASCGFASHVLEAGAGEVCNQPFRQPELDQRLRSMLERLPTAPWSENGRRYGRTAALYDLPGAAADAIEEIASRCMVIEMERDE